MLTGLLLLAGLAGSVATAQQAPRSTPIQIAFDRPIDALAAPFVLALSDGLFAAERLSVSTQVVAGPAAAIARVASGASELALVDLNALVRYRDKAEAAPIKAVYVLLNAAPYAVIARRSRGVQTLADLSGKTLGVADGDQSIPFWPALARVNGIKPQTVKQERIGAAVREPMLSAGQVDAVTGFSYLSAVNLRDRGIPADDLAVLRYADFGCAAYGAALIVNPAFAANEPDALRRLLLAVTNGVKLAIANPRRAADAATAQIEGGSRDLEFERLRTVLRDNIVTDEVRRNGLGGLDPARFATSIDQLGEDFKFRQKPVAADIFDSAFLPDALARKLD